MPVLDTILLVDDDDTTNYLHTRLLKRLNVANKIDVTTNGGEALQYLVDHCRSTPEAAPVCPTLVFLDLKMPVVDGFEFLEQYEQIKEELNPDIRILVLTSSMAPQDTERLKKYPSVQHHFTKPLSETIVKQILNS